MRTILWVGAVAVLVAVAIMAYRRMSATRRMTSDRRTADEPPSKPALYDTSRSGSGAPLPPAIRRVAEPAGAWTGSSFSPSAPGGDDKVDVDFG